MQLESHVLQPLLLRRAVQLHPLAVVLAIAVGLLTAGIAGALLAVPLLAVLNSGIRSLRSEADEHVDPADVHISEPEESGPDQPGLDTEAGPKKTSGRSRASNAATRDRDPAIRHGPRQASSAGTVGSPPCERNSGPRRHCSGLGASEQGHQLSAHSPGCVSPSGRHRLLRPALESWSAGRSRSRRGRRGPRSATP